MERGREKAAEGGAGASGAAVPSARTGNRSGYPDCLNVRTAAWTCPYHVSGGSEVEGFSPTLLSFFSLVTRAVSTEAVRMIFQGTVEARGSDRGLRRRNLRAVLLRGALQVAGFEGKVRNETGRTPGTALGKRKRTKPQLRPSVLALPVFPVRLQTSIFGRDELNFRVRNGNGWTLILISTNCISFALRPENRTESIPCFASACILDHPIEDKPSAD